MRLQDTSCSNLLLSKLRSSVEPPEHQRPLTLQPSASKIEKLQRKAHGVEGSIGSLPWAPYFIAGWACRLRGVRLVSWCSSLLPRFSANYGSDHELSSQTAGNCQLDAPYTRCSDPEIQTRTTLLEHVREVRCETP